MAQIEHVRSKVDDLIMNPDFHKDVKLYEDDKVTVTNLSKKYKTSRQTIYDVFKRMTPNPIKKRDDIRRKTNLRIARLLDDGVPIGEVATEHQNIYQNTTYINRLIRNGDIPVKKYKTETESKAEREARMIDDFEEHLEIIHDQLGADVNDERILEKFKQEYPAVEEANGYGIHQDIFRNYLKRYYNMKYYNDIILTNYHKLD